MPQCSRNNLLQMAAEQSWMTREANSLSRKTREHKPPPGKKRLRPKAVLDQRHNLKLRMRAKRTLAPPSVFLSNANYVAIRAQSENGFTITSSSATRVFKVMMWRTWSDFACAVLVDRGRNGRISKRRLDISPVGWPRLEMLHIRPTTRLTTSYKWCSSAFNQVIAVKGLSTVCEQGAKADA